MKNTKLAEFIKHMVEADAFNPETFTYQRTISETTEDGEYQVRGSFVHGSGFIEGVLGEDAHKFRLYFNQLQGFQFWLYGDNDAIINTSSWQPHQLNDVYTELNHWINL